jgi:hypothetical protein
MFFSGRYKTYLKQLLEQEKLINRLKRSLDEKDDAYLKLLEEFRKYREENQPKVWVAQDGAPPMPTTQAQRIKRINYPQDRGTNSPEATKERLVELFGDPGDKKYGN